MGYKRAEEILPVEVMELVQQYVDGQSIYIPKKADCRSEWGSGTTTKRELGARNKGIYTEYLAGAKISELADKYYLSEKSIQRIIRQQKK